MKQLAAAEKKEEFNPNVLDAMRMLKQSWSMRFTALVHKKRGVRDDIKYT